ncbi:hypothetical protein RBSH_04624 [Rhodopirellula baltica SH28]|uniref:Uncharacterized protein n=1 Tax=Rhodopirellula baltica SH28 TaxID=993517 RepID=K5DCC6_RHOBT|nr:hypothetical protein RBSH_04624 [Rhodopirellula baltica SH28]
MYDDRPCFVWERKRKPFDLGRSLFQILRCGQFRCDFGFDFLLGFVSWYGVPFADAESNYEKIDIKR